MSTLYRPYTDKEITIEVIEHSSKLTVLITDRNGETELKTVRMAPESYARFLVEMTQPVLYNVENPKEFLAEHIIKKLVV